MAVSTTILAVTVQLIKSRGILRSKAMRMAEQGRLATAPNITIHLPSSICPLGIGEFPHPCSESVVEPCLMALPVAFSILPHTTQLQKVT
jgi:hypothetical protein